jgi:hypothetical protein
MSAATRGAPIAFAVGVAIALTSEIATAAVCPAGDYVVTSRKGAPVRNIHVDLAAKRILIDGSTPEFVRVRRTDGESHVRAAFGGGGSRRVLTVSFRIEARTCSAFRGRAAINRRLLRRAIGGRLPRGLRTRFWFTATRTEIPESESREPVLSAPDATAP